MNILVLTSNYPSKDIPKTMTPVVHYFAREWVKMGHNVNVVHTHVVFPNWEYVIIKLFRKYLEDRVGFTFLTKRLKDKDYEKEGVHVHRRIMQKKYPASNFSEKDYLRQVSRIREVINSMNVMPDIVIGHFFDPQLPLVAELKKQIGIKSGVIAHVGFQPYVDRGLESRFIKYLKMVDFVGFRSLRIKKDYESRVDLSGTFTFLCPSGIPDSYITNMKERNDIGFRSITFVGSLISRKHPDSIIEAVHLAGITASINFVGIGPMKERLIKMVNHYNLQNKVHFFNQISRQEVGSIMENSDLFVMISEDEAFGLVYLEAMSKGCITVCSRGDGIDGIIKHGVNGYLCNSGDAKELAQLFRCIQKESKENLLRISRSAQETTRHLTDKEVAKSYLGFITS